VRKIFLSPKPLLAVATISLTAFSCWGAAGAARVTQAASSRSVLASGHLSAAPLRATHRGAVATVAGAPGCTPVVISSAVQGDLSEPVAMATAAMVITQPGNYHGLNIDGTGCDIALYIAQGTKNVTVSDSVIHDGTRAGIVADTTSNTLICGDAVYNTGNHMGTVYMPNGVQYGFAVLVESAKNAIIQNVSASQYQKEGFLYLNSTGSVSYNMATGSGMVNYIASNGFEIDASDLNTITDNRTELNQYTGPIYGGAGYIICGTSIKHRLLDPSSMRRFANNLENLSAFDDIPYYFSKNANCS